MSRVHTMKNTDKDYPCTSCGGEGNIVANTPDPRVKCNACGFTYNASDSTAAKEAGAVPDGPPRLEDNNPPRAELASEAASNPREAKKDNSESQQEKVVVQEEKKTQEVKVPRTPKYVAVTKNRKEYVFCTERDLKKTLLNWEAREYKYDVFELSLKRVSAKVDIE